MGLIGRLPIRQPTGKSIQLLGKKRGDRFMLYSPLVRVMSDLFQ